IVNLYELTKLYSSQIFVSPVLTLFAIFNESRKPVREINGTFSSCCLSYHVFVPIFNFLYSNNLIRLSLLLQDDRFMFKPEYH
ncbi:MAG: hypothetical protein ACKOPK_09975, partial [Dolichospermum sp.]